MCIFKILGYAKFICPFFFWKHLLTVLQHPLVMHMIYTFDHNLLFFFFIFLFSVSQEKNYSKKSIWAICGCMFVCIKPALGETSFNYLLLSW